MRAGGWVVLTYRDAPSARPRRPMLRLLRAGGAVQEIVLPGVAAARAHWLGLIPADVREIGLAAGPGFVLARVGRRGEAGLLLQALRTRPLRAVSALFERLRGDERRYRDTLRGVCAVTPLSRYADWAAARGDGTAASPTASAGEAPGDARIRVLVLADGDGRACEATLASLRAQTHRGWHAVVLGGGDPPGTSGDPRIAHRPWRDDRPLRDLTGDGPLCLLSAGDRLAPEALTWLAAALGIAPPSSDDPDAAEDARPGSDGADLAYGDERREGAFRLKPDWSPDLARATGYQGRPWLAAARLLRRLPDGPAGPAGAFPLVLEGAFGAARHVAHIPRILADTVGPDPEAPARAAALVRPDAGCEALIRDGALDLHWPLPSPAPLVSVVIPSRDRLDLIARVCRGVLHETAYPAIECVIVDNGSTDPAVLAHYAVLRRDPRVRIVPHDAPFNFSAMVNAGVAVAAGAVVVLLNNDVAVLDSGWLDAMVRQAVRPEVGAVGARLLYADGRLQHAGVVVGLGGRAGHILRRRAGDSPGHLGRMRVAHEVSAVTAACLAVSRENYRRVGGFDAEAFPVDFNDVDFCLRLGAAGYGTVWTPAATLAHLESVSRGPSVGAKRLRFEQEAARFTERWRDVIRHDPFYHPALSLTTFGEDLE